jgi:hypothetical protein
MAALFDYSTNDDTALIDILDKITRVSKLKCSGLLLTKFEMHVSKYKYSYLLKNMGSHEQFWLATPHMWLPNIRYICIEIPLNKPANFVFRHEKR